MAKINRIVARIFGSSAGIDQISKFGSLAAGSPDFTTDAAQAQSLSNWLTGWFGAVIGGNAPAIEDMNAAMFVMTYQLAYLMQAGIPEWNTDTIYYIGSLANVSGVIYSSLTDANTGNNPATDLVNWQIFSPNTSVVTKTANYTITRNDRVVAANAVGGAFNLTLPPATNKQTLYLKKLDASGNVVTVLPSGGDVIEGNLTSYDMTIQNEALVMVGDGSGSWMIFD